MGWISVEDRLPEPMLSYEISQHVLVWESLPAYLPRIGEYSYTSGDWYHVPLGYRIYVTHWMPLPDPPAPDYDNI